MPFFRQRWLAERLRQRGRTGKLRALIERPELYHRHLMLSMVGLAGNDQSLRLKTGQYLFFHTFMSYYIFEEIFLDKIYEVQSQDIFNIIDVGANTGMFTLWAKIRWPKAHIVAYEPDPQNFALLSKLIEKNALRDVMPIEAAVSPVEGSVTLFLHSRNIGGHSTVKPSACAVSVKACPISSALDLFPSGVCDLLKLDCEGAEDAILRSLTPEAARRVRYLVYEPEERVYPVAALNEHLRTLGFQITREHGLFFGHQCNHITQ